MANCQGEEDVDENSWAGRSVRGEQYPAKSKEGDGHDRGIAKALMAMAMGRLIGMARGWGGA